MDFIIDLLRIVRQYDSITVVVDKLAKVATLHSIEDYIFN